LKNRWILSLKADSFFSYKLLLTVLSCPSQFPRSGREEESENSREISLKNSSKSQKQSQKVWMEEDSLALTTDTQADNHLTLLFVPQQLLF